MLKSNLTPKLAHDKWVTKVPLNQTPTEFLTVSPALTHNKKGRNIKSELN
mgnify:CR=1 FL=1